MLMKFKLYTIIEVLQEIEDEGFVMVDMLVFNKENGEDVERVKRRIDKDSWRRYKMYGSYPVS